jgi:hypothetical protein
VVYDTDLTGHIARPAYGVTPAKSIAAAQYTGSVVWTKTITQVPLIGSFQSDIEYTATVTLSPRSGYTFIGIEADVFTHEDAPGAVTNAAGSGAVTINFPPEAFLNYTAVTFGPSGAAGSALKVMMDRSDEERAVSIEIPAETGPEEIIPNSIYLVGELNTPANVTIDGHGRVLRVSSPGTFLTVGENVNLTLRNLTVKGNAANNSPLITVLPKGRLTLEGTILEENETTANTGGVWVNGGTLVMNQGSAIRKMKVTITPSGDPNKGGGVVIDNNGRFTMNGGSVGGENSGDGNIIGDPSSYVVGAGGVLVSDGGFDMHGGIIGYNSSASSSTVHGGVVVSSGAFFNQYGGTIKGNTAGNSGAGGVSNNGTFTMDGAEAYIEANSGGELGIGGVSNEGTFIMRAGTIQNNRALGPPAMMSGGGFAGGVSNGGTFEMYGGIIRRNSAEGDSTSTASAGGVFVRGGTFTMYDGTIGGGPEDANIATGTFGNLQANGVCVYFSRFVMAGGTITGNTHVSAANDYGVYVHYQNYGSEPYTDDQYANFTMRGSALITPDNKVCLYSQSGANNKTITIGGGLSASPYVANIVMKGGTLASGTPLLRANSDTLITQNNCDKFLYDGVSGRIIPSDVGGTWYGVYQP